MIHNSKTMKGFVFVAGEGHKNKKDFDYLIKICLEFNKIEKASKKKEPLNK